jgi:hypothetical protein
MASLVERPPGEMLQDQQIPEESLWHLELFGPSSSGVVGLPRLSLWGFGKRLAALPAYVCR